MLLLLLLGLLSSSRADLGFMNGAVDKILLEAKEAILRSGEEVIPLDEIKDEFTYRAAFIKVKSYLHCWDGSMQNTSTLERADDVIVSNSTDQVNLLIPMNMTDFMFRFNNCRIDIPHAFRKTSKVFVKFEENSINASLTLNLNDDTADCTATFEQLKFDYNKRHMQFYSADIISDAQDRILPSFQRHLSRQLTSFFSRYMNELIKGYLPDTTLCFNTTSTIH